MSPEAEARKPNYTTFHSSVSNWNNSTQQWGPLCEMTLPYYFVLAQCFHKFRLGAEPSAVFFQGLHSRVLFLRSCCSALFFPSAARTFSPCPPQPWLACGSAGRSLYWRTCASLEHFPHPLGQMFYVFGPEQPFGFCDEEPLKTTQRPLAHILWAICILLPLLLLVTIPWEWRTPQWALIN